MGKIKGFHVHTLNDLRLCVCGTARYTLGKVYWYKNNVHVSVLMIGYDAMYSLTFCILKSVISSAYPGKGTTY
jgi:hypothetical protein